MIRDRAKVYVIEDDDSVRRALRRLLSSAGFEGEALATSEMYLARSAADPRACLVLDVRMRGMSGLDLQRAIAGTRLERPVIFITGHGDEALRREALGLGAVDVLFKPLDAYALLHAVDRAL